MNLFLASEAKDALTTKKLKKYLGKDYKKKNVIYIPTAANAIGYGGWKRGTSVKTALKLFPNIRVLELEDCFYRDIKNDFEKTDIIWMAGGSSGYLLY